MKLTNVQYSQNRFFVVIFLIFLHKKFYYRNFLKWLFIIIFYKMIYVNMYNEDTNSNNSYIIWLKLKIQYETFDTNDTSIFSTIHHKFTPQRNETHYKFTPKFETKTLKVFSRRDCVINQQHTSETLKRRAQEIARSRRDGFNERHKYCSHKLNTRHVVLQYLYGREQLLSALILWVILCMGVVIRFWCGEPAGDGLGVRGGCV